MRLDVGAQPIHVFSKFEEPILLFDFDNLAPFLAELAIRAFQCLLQNL